MITLQTEGGAYPPQNAEQRYSYGIVLIRAEEKANSIAKDCPQGESADPPAGNGGDAFGR
jgi:hypothetical protein